MLKKARNSKNNYVKLIVDSKVYPLSTIYAAGYIFLDKAYIYLDKNKNGKIEVSLYAKKDKEDMDKLKKEFYNELLNYAHYFSSLKSNTETTKMLLQRALFSTAPSLVKEAEEKEIEDLIKELEEEEQKDKKVS